MQAFAPNAESGIITIEFNCQLNEPLEAHYMMVIPKRTLLDLVPSGDDPRLKAAGPFHAPVVLWETIAPRVRLFGPDVVPSGEWCAEGLSIDKLTSVTDESQLGCVMYTKTDSSCLCSRLARTGRLWIALSIGSDYTISIRFE